MRGVQGSPSPRDEATLRRIALDEVCQPGPLQFSDLIEWVCEAEGVTLAELAWLEVREGDVIARLTWPTGRSRVSTYPLAAFSRWQRSNSAFTRIG
jgi:hypothetical protein